MEDKQKRLPIQWTPLRLVAAFLMVIAIIQLAIRSSPTMVLAPLAFAAMFIAIEHRRTRRRK